MAPAAIDQGPVDERVRAVGGAHERERDVRAVIEVDREPVPAAPADRDEVAPLVVEPGVAGHGQLAAAQGHGPRRGHRGPRVVVGAARRPEVHVAVAVVQRRGLARREPQVQPEAVHRVAPDLGTGRPRLQPIAAARHRPWSTACPPGSHRDRPGPMPRTANANPVGTAAVARRPVDLRPDLGSAARSGTAPPVSSVSARWDAQVTGNPPRSARKTTYSKPKRLPVGGAKVPRVVPPLGQAVVRTVVARQDDRLRVGAAGACRWRGGHDRMGGRAGWRGRARRTPRRRARARRRRPRGRAGRGGSSDRGLHLGLGPRQDPLQRAVEPRGHPPVPAAEEPHRRRHEQRPDDGRVEGDRDRDPSPSALISTMSAKANEPATTTTISAAELTIRPLRSRPRATASVLSPVRSQASFIRVSRNTS